MFILFCSIFKDHFLSQLYAVTILSPSSDLLSISLDSTPVNNFFKLFFFQSFKLFFKFNLLLIALSDVFYSTIDQIYYLAIKSILIKLYWNYSYFLLFASYIIHWYARFIILLIILLTVINNSYLLYIYTNFYFIIRIYYF